MDSENRFCGCVGYAYIPPQQLNEVFCAEDALKNASLFPELVLTMCEYGNTCKQKGVCQNGQTGTFKKASVLSVCDV